MVIHYKNQSIEKRLTQHGWVVDNNGCWIWQGSASIHGYGQHMINRKQYRVHRLAFETWVRPLQPGEVVRHKCDVKLCINPDHLIAGTQQENMDDKMARGRHSTAGPKLSMSEATDIRQEYEKGVITQKMLSDIYGVSYESINNIIRNITWRAA